MLLSVIFNDMTELSTTILELIFEGDTDYFSQISNLVYGEVVDRWSVKTTYTHRLRN